MAAFTNYTVNKILVDTIFRNTPTTIPGTLYYALFVASRGYAAVSTAYAVNDTVLPASPNGRIYKCTAAGTSSATAPTWPTTNGGTVVDGGVTWTEQTPAMLAGTGSAGGGFTEATYTGYARVAQAASLANWAGTQGAGTTVASTGTSGQTSNNNVITYGAPTSQQAGVVAGVFLCDASTNGNAIAYAMLTNPKTINNGDAAPNFPAAAFTFTYA